MRPHIAVFDNFFAPSHAEVANDYLTLAKYEDYVSPTDGVTYPGILREIPQQFSENIAVKLWMITNEKVRIRTCFARLTSSAQTEAPNKIHSDRIMGDGAALLYMNKNWEVGQGTSFWIHKKFGESHTDAVVPEEIRSNDYSDWTYRLLVPGKFNRLLLYDAKLWHCAEPIGGFGCGPSDGRIVLTCFFDYV